MKHDYIKKRWLNFIGVILILSFSGCIATGGGAHVDWGDKSKETRHPAVYTKKGGPPPHAPAHGYRAKYNYYYYPGSSVYYDTYRKLYFYLEGNNWRVSVSLPQDIRVKLGDHVSIEMGTDKPYTYHEEHSRKYPQGQFKKKSKKK